jgi:soluble lytic murein transglycosylase-like protein
MLSMLAGGGLTAVGLGSPLSGGALGAEVPAGASGAGENSSTPVSETSSEGSAQQSTGASSETPQPTTTTSTTPTPSSTSTETPAPPSVSTPSPAPETPVSGSAPEPPAPTVVVQRKQRTTPARRANRALTHTKANLGSGSGQAGSGAKKSTGAAQVPAGAPNGVAGAPLTVAAQAGSLSTLLAGSAVSAQALDYYRIPLFLLPIYQAAGIQYGVPWQILAAINEVETDYGSDLSVSTAGAVGWMQFMPQTWMQYGVDAVDAGYADPFNPVDAVFAAARYLHAAGASTNLHAAILAYNHSDAYVSSVLLRAKLIASYPRSVVATLTGLTEGVAPVAGAHVGFDPNLLSGPGTAVAATPLSVGTSTAASGASNATGNAVPATSAGAAHAASSARSGDRSARTPGTSAAPSPLASAAQVEAKANRAAKREQLSELLSSPNASVVAVEDGRVVGLGNSRKLGRYLVLRDIYGDVFTYAGLGSIAPRYRTPDLHPARASGKAIVASKGISEPLSATHDPAPKQPASAGHQAPLTLKVRKHSSEAVVPESESVEPAAAPAGMGKPRLFAHPGNPVAKQAATKATRQTTSDGKGGRWLVLRRGSVVSQGTVLGHVRVPAGATDGHMHFAIRPAGDRDTIDPRPLMANWKQLDASLHPQGATGGGDLLGATTAGVFLMSKSELERAVLSDPGIDIYECGRQDIASGAIDRRVLAVLAFLSRSGLKPTVSALRCGHSEYTTSGNISEHSTGDAVDISAVNGIPIAGHQGAGSITDTTIRALLTLQGQFVPHQIISLMQYPGASNTLALPEHWNHIHVGFRPVGATVPLDSAASATAAHSAASGQTAPSPLVVTGDLSSTQWTRLMARIAALPEPTVASKPSSSAIRDPQASPGNHGLGRR